MNVKAFIKRHLARFTLNFWIWLANACVLTYILSSLCLKIFLSGHLLTQQALESGQRVILSIASGETEGNPRHTAHAKLAVETATDDTRLGALDAPGTKSKDGLAPAPLASITQESDKGPLPIVGGDGTVPWKYYARPFLSQEKRPQVAIVLTNMGLSKSLTTDAFSLPHTITFSFSPYAGDAKIWAKKAREAGFESLVDLPMEPQDYPLTDPGPYGLLDNLTPEESSARLRWVLSRFPGFVGALAPIDEKLTADLNALRPALVEFAARGILFVYLKTPQNMALAELSKSHNLYILGADEVVDADLSQSAIEKQLQNLVDLAKKQGYAIGIAHSYPPTTEALTEWAAGLSAQGVDLVPLSAIAKQAFP